MSSVGKGNCRWFIWVRLYITENNTSFILGVCGKCMTLYHMIMMFVRNVFEMILCYCYILKEEHMLSLVAYSQWQLYFYADCSDIGIAWIQLIPFWIWSQKRIKLSVFHVFFSFIFAYVGEKGLWMTRSWNAFHVLLVIKVVVNNRQRFGSVREDPKWTVYNLWNLNQTEPNHETVKLNH